MALAKIKTSLAFLESQLESRLSQFFFNLLLSDILLCHKTVAPILSSLEVIFVDRDGVINEEPGPILTPEHLLFIPGSLDAILEINRLKKLCIIVSNQAAFARGLLTQEMFQQICLKLDNALAEIGAHLG